MKIGIITPIFEEEYKSTLGVDFLEKNVVLEENVKVTLVLWDIAGQSKYATFREDYYKGTHFIIVVFDITNFKSFQNINRWVTNATEVLGTNLEFAILANKIDLTDQRAIEDYPDFKTYENLFDFAETSAKTGENVNEILIKIAKYLYQKLENV